MHAALRTQLVARLQALPALASASAVVLWQPSHPNQGAPLVVLRLVSDQRGASHAGSDGLGNARVQVDVYATQAADAVALRDAILGDLHGFAGRVVTDGERIASCFHDSSLEDYDVPARLFRSSCDLLVQYHLPSS